MGFQENRVFFFVEVDLQIPPLYRFRLANDELVAMYLRLTGYFDLLWFETYNQTYHDLGKGFVTSLLPEETVNTSGRQDNDVYTRCCGF